MLQCQLGGVTRSGLYCEPSKETAEHLTLMRPNERVPEPREQTPNCAEDVRVYSQFP